MNDDGTASTRAAQRKAGRTARTWKLTLAYDGGHYAGWQVQPGLVTVQGTLARALERITGEQVLPQGSGRTDAGVHALGQVASFRLCAAIPARNLQQALNQRLPSSLRVLAAEPAADSFHARHSSRSKLYEYRIWRGELCPPWTAPYVFACPWPLQVDAMQQAAAAVLGEHDFRSFAAREPDFTMRRAGKEPSPRMGSSMADPSAFPDSYPPAAPVPGHDPESAGTESSRASNCVRCLLVSTWEQRDRDLLCYQVRGTGFLHHMVRNLVGTFLAVGQGQLAPSAIPSILEARDRSAAGSTAPARGLFLHSVEY